MTKWTGRKKLHPWFSNLSEQYLLQQCTSKTLRKMKIMQAVRNRMINILKQKTPFAFLINNIQGLISCSLSSLPFFYKDNCYFFWLILQSSPSWSFSSLSLDYQLGQSRFFLLDWKKNLSHFSRTSVSIHTTSIFRTKRFLAPVLSGGEQPIVGQHCGGHTPLQWGFFMAQPL